MHPLLHGTRGFTDAMDDSSSLVIRMSCRRPDCGVSCLRHRTALSPLRSNFAIRASLWWDVPLSCLLQSRKQDESGDEETPYGRRPRDCGLRYADATGARA